MSDVHVADLKSAHFIECTTEIAGQALDPTVVGAVGNFLGSSIKSQKGGIDTALVHDFLSVVLRAETEENGLAKGSAFRYPAVSDIPEFGSERTAANTVSSARDNASFMISYFGLDSFLVDDPKRKRRVIEHTIDIDDFVLKMRGGSGTGCFSIDLGLGFNAATRYNELWRTGFDTEHHGDTMGARIIRTGTGVKPGEEAKEKKFDEFRRNFGIMPQRLLGLTCLYLMREVNPDYLLAMSSEGAVRISTLGRSKGRCNYTGIFENIGFQQTPDPYYLSGGAGHDAFYDTLSRANISRGEADALHLFCENIQDHMEAQTSQGETSMIIDVCSQDDPGTLERELAVYI
jgi:hypothetical protein